MSVVSKGFGVRDAKKFVALQAAGGCQGTINHTPFEGWIKNWVDSISCMFIAANNSKEDQVFQ